MVTTTSTRMSSRTTKITSIFSTRMTKAKTTKITAALKTKITVAIDRQPASQMKGLILASSSPRRHELLRATGLPFEVARPDIDETPHPGESPDVYVTRLSREKALAISGSTGNLILSADTTVADGQQILGKPADPAEAAAML